MGQADQRALTPLIRFIRAYGAGRKSSYLYLSLYRHVFDNPNVTLDPTNNANPRKVLERLSGFARQKRVGFEQIRNYQISHVFGRTKNVLAFCAPWNIVYLPKIMDPFTGHEAKGNDVDEFTKMFQAQCWDQFQELILDFNKIMLSDHVREKLELGIENVALENELLPSQKELFETSVRSEFAPIEAINHTR